MNFLISKWRNNRLAQNSFWMFLGQGGRIPIQAVCFILIARSLGAQGYGAFVGVTALVAILAPFTSMGSGNILIKNVARDQKSFQRYWGKALVLTLLSGGGLVIFAIVLSRVILPPQIPLALVISISLADLIFNRLIDISAQAFQALQRLARTSQLMVLPNITRLLFLGCMLLFTRHPSATIWGYYYLFSIFICSLFAVLFVNRELGTPIFDKICVFSEMREGLYFSFSLSSQNIYNDIDKTMLTRLASFEAAGIYGAAYRVIDVAFTPIRSLLYASYTQFFQRGASDGICGTLAFAAKLLPFAVGYGFVASVVLFVSAPILPFLLGSDYFETVYALRWLSILPLLKAFHYFAGDSLTGAGFQGMRSVCQLVTALLNVMLILWLIPKYSWEGAAWASIATDSLLALAMWILVLWLRKNEKHTHASCRSAIRA